MGGRVVSVAAFSTATTVEEAVAALAGGARPVAGGTDLVVGARSGKAPLPGSIVAIHRVAELRGVELLADGGLRLGALASHAEIAASEAVRSSFTALSDACAIVGSHATRAQGTVGGNLMNASPAMETGGPLVCFGASRRAPLARRHALARDRGALGGPRADDRTSGRTARRDRGSRSRGWNRQRLPPARIPPPDGDRGRRRDGCPHGRGRHRHRRQSRDDGPLADDQARTGCRGGAHRERRRGRCDRGGRRGSRRSGEPDLRRARVGRLPARDGLGDRPARDRTALLRARGGAA